ncbi:hypothetical protein Brsp05_02785 [Brucella sp. NBRC 12953]|uniref:hypothetical protein n=1 Tax=Brucella sp. NBRC 12953 TaxID=3075481 RepID=UPI0030AAF509
MTLIDRLSKLDGPDRQDGFANFCRYNVEAYLLDTWLHMHHDRKPVRDEQVIEEVRPDIIESRISLLKLHIVRMEALLRAKGGSKWQRLSL